MFLIVAEEIAAEDVTNITSQVVQEPQTPVAKSEPGKCRPMSLFLFFTTETKIIREK